MSRARHLQGRLVGQMEALGFRVREEAVLRTLTEDVLKSSEIEGEKLDADQVRSSVARQLGIDIAETHVDGTSGTVLFGLTLMTNQLATEYGGAAVAGIAAHE